MRIRGMPVRVRTLLATIVVLAIAFASIREAAIWHETRKLTTFHEQRARWLRDQATRFPSELADLGGEFRRFADWHDERAVSYRKAHKTYFSDEMKEDLRQTMREQETSQPLYAGPRTPTTRPSPAIGP